MLRPNSDYLSPAEIEAAPAHQDSGPRTVDFLEMARILRRRWRFVVITACAFAAAALVYVLSATIQYTATSTVLVDPRRARELQPGVTRLYEAIEIMGAEGLYEDGSNDGCWWRPISTVFWYSAWGDPMDLDTLQVEYVVEAHFDAHGTLIDVSVVDNRSDPSGRGGSNLISSSEDNLFPGRRIRRNAESGGLPS